MRRTTASPLAVCLAVLIAAGAARAAAPHDRRFYSVRQGVGVEAPTGWTLSQHTGYPSILVVLLHPDGSRISLSAGPTPARDAHALAEQNRPVLEAQKAATVRETTGPRGGALVEIRRSDRDEIVRQLYLVRPLPDATHQAVVLTLVTRADHLASATAGFDWAVAHLTLEPPGGQPPADKDSLTTPDAGR
jgi:hypothetical protein